MRIVGGLAGCLIWATAALAAESPYADQLAFLGPYPGERRPTPPPSEEKVAEREWPGQPLPWWSWTHFTGDWQFQRTRLATNGLTFGGKYLLDSSVVLSGGQQRRGVMRGLLDLNLTFDPQPLLGIEGGTFFAQYYLLHGRNGNGDVGSLQGFSSIDDRRFNRAEEVWYEQELLQDRLRLKVGQVDANAEFDLLPAAGEFIDPSAGQSPNVPLPTYPGPALSANLFVYPLAWLYCGTGVYAENFCELSSHSFEHPFVVAEAGVTHTGFGQLGPGRLALGGWHQSGSLDRFDGRVAKGTAGFFAAAEQQVWKENPAQADDQQGLSLFTQYAWADPQLSAITHHIGIGVSALGLVPKRDCDCAGLYWTCGLTSRVSGAGFDHNECDLELFYSFQLTPFLSFKPDLQWFQHPGGHSSSSNVLVATARLTITF